MSTIDCKVTSRINEELYCRLDIFQSKEENIATFLDSDHSHPTLQFGVSIVEFIESLPIESKPQAVDFIANAIDTMPEGSRVVLSLRIIEELSYKEIARVLDVSETTALQLYEKALGSLFRALKRTQIR
jgi:RNA polymerase sigma factor (sigma-70 family)